MARLLACWELGLGLGHLAVLSPVAQALRARGHESWLAACDVVAAQDTADAPFARVLQAPRWLGLPVQGSTLGYGQVFADAGFGDSAGLQALVAAWLGLVDLVRPAALYTEHAPGALLAAYIAGLRAVRLGSPFVCPPAARPLPTLMPWQAASPAERAGADAVADAAVRDVCRAFGAPVLDGLAELLATAPPFLASWPELNPLPPRHDSAWYGPLVPIEHEPPPAWPAVAGPRVVVYLPFDRPAAAPLAAALARRGWPVLWISAGMPGHALPASIRHSCRPVAIGPVLATAQVFVGRSHGAVLAAMAAGVPQLLLPDNVESRTLALAIAAQGQAQLPESWDEAAIGALLDALAAPDAPEAVAARAAAARHAGHDPAAATTRLAADMLAALGLD
jgi:hypothetical protein